MGKRKHKGKKGIVKDLKKKTTRNTLRMQERDRRGITFLCKIWAEQR